MKALLIIDMLKDFVYEDGALPVPKAVDLVPFINREIRKFRNEGLPIIFVCDSHSEDDEEFKLWGKHCIKGTRGAEIVDELEKEENDLIIEKTRYSGFYKTNLNDVLKEKGIEEVVLTGVLTDVCVLYTAADAMFRGYGVTVLKEGVASINEENHKWALKHMKEILKAKIV
ncbi:MAG: cysteine hydrolase [Thermoplasmata archaeon]|nr:MAG: cysteine hydrolase [Thermoplasmata archaeon]